jgi:DNA polymerase-3 subunit gamma/tau
MAEASARALYLAWRPSNFADVVGQEHVVRTIRNAVRMGKLGHAYLFAGPRGTGKTTMARLLFKAANCRNSVDGAPCESCDICTTANQGRALDLIELDAASNRGIDDIRDLRDKINFAPGSARFRVYILDEAHQLTTAAWDALLKTLEEPPPHAILVLATTEAHRVPATVLSRCQRFDFHRLSALAIRQRLVEIAATEDIQVEPVVFTWIASAARGGMRDAISLLDQLRAYGGERIDAATARAALGLAGLEVVGPFVDALREDRVGDTLDELHAALDRGVDLRVFVGDAVGYLRAMLMIRAGARASLEADFPAEEVAWIDDRAMDWGGPRLRGLIKELGDGLARLRDASQLQLHVELALLASPAVDEIVAERPRVPIPRAAPSSPSPQPEPPPMRPDDADSSLVDGYAEEVGDAPPPAPRASLDITAPSDPRPEPESPAPLDPIAVRDVWEELRSRVAGGNLAWAWLTGCQLGDVRDDTLVIWASRGQLTFVSDKAEVREMEKSFSKHLGGLTGQPLTRPIKLQFREPSTETATSPAIANDPRTLAERDPVVSAGLRLFGGPLERVED